MDILSMADEKPCKIKISSFEKNKLCFKTHLCAFFFWHDHFLVHECCKCCLERKKKKQKHLYKLLSVKKKRFSYISLPPPPKKKKNHHHHHAWSAMTYWVLKHLANKPWSSVRSPFWSSVNASRKTQHLNLHCQLWIGFLQKMTYNAVT